ncbi:MAG: BREX-1 system adenine-specific DNA-methyltransferase PglX [Bacteroidales bacterium]
MNTTLLKRFAQEARKKLIQQVGAKLEWVLQADTPELREKREQLTSLKKELQQSSKEQLIDRVAYTWFNRLVALRFMDLNGYQPLRMQVLSPVTEHGDPEILQMAKQGNFSAELKLNQQQLLDLLDGRVPSSNPQNEVYRALLIASCNYLHTIFPFLFERINDYTELLLPDDLISNLSIVNDIIKGMSREDCQQVEVMGWLYQFYIADRKDEVFASKGKVKKEDIPAATQLFTPRWIVEYMVQNTIGKLWLQNNPNSSLRQKMPYYIEAESSKSEEYLKISSPEEITLLDQACGSGHILVYGFELLYLIYEEAGYTTSHIPKLIIEKNLFGYEIDQRAAQFASFAVLMKARSYYRQLFREKIVPNILSFVDLTLSEKEIESLFTTLQHKPSDNLKADLITMQQATNFGSLIQPKTEQRELETLLNLIAKTANKPDLFLKNELDQLSIAISQLHCLGNKFHCVVQNPPYMGGGKMNSKISDFVRTNYADAKADLFSCFIDLSISRVLKHGLIGNVTMESWMFLSSFEKFRKNLLEIVTIDSLSHFGWHIMRIAFGTVSFILKNSQPNENERGIYNYLEIEDIDKETERPISFPNKERRYRGVILGIG